MKGITLVAMLAALLALAAVTASAADPQGEAAKTTPASAAVTTLNWYSVNGGGITLGSSASSKLGLSVGQSVAGVGTSASFKLGVGFWQGAGSFCATPGDLDGDGFKNLVDILIMIYNVSDNQPIPTGEVCADLTGDGLINLVDIICLINHVSFDDPLPC
jgi:hypothetical protein